MVHEDPSHGAGHKGEEVGFLGRQRAVGVDQAHVGLVRERGRLQRVGAAGFVSTYDQRLESSSLAIDGGNNLGDYLPFTTGYQSPPALDLGGTGRVVDGDGDGTATIDIGAYEFK